MMVNKDNGIFKVFTEDTEFQFPLLTPYEFFYEALITKHILWSTQYYGNSNKSKFLFELMQQQLRNTRHCVVIEPELGRKDARRLINLGYDNLTIHTLKNHQVIYVEENAPEEYKDFGQAVYSVFPFGVYVMAFFNPDYELQQLLDVDRYEANAKCILDSEGFIHVDNDDVLMLLGLNKTFSAWPEEIRKLIRE